MDSNAAVEAVNAGQVAILAGRQREVVVVVADDVAFAGNIERAVRISFNRSIFNVDNRVASDARDLLNLEVINNNIVAIISVGNVDALVVHSHRTGRRDCCIFHAANVAGACDSNELASSVDTERDVFVVVGEGQGFVDLGVLVLVLVLNSIVELVTSSTPVTLLSTVPSSRKLKLSSPSIVNLSPLLKNE